MKTAAVSERDVYSHLACLSPPTSINVKLSPLETVQITSVVLTKWGKMWFQLPKDSRISEGEGKCLPTAGEAAEPGWEPLIMALK